MSSSQIHARLQPLNEPSQILRRTIAEHGVIPFARFMELALYCPQTGFYERERDTIGRRGHFYTSVSTGSLFGELLAAQFAEWLEAEVKARTSEVCIVEAGAHDGQLAKDILAWIKRHRPALFANLTYVICEPSVCRRGWQEPTLTEFAPRVRWFERIADARGTVKEGRVKGVIFCNELLDAMPVRRFGWDAKRREWFEWGVTANGEAFEWARLPGGGDVVAEAFPGLLPAELLDVLPDEFSVEVCPAAVHWWTEAANLLECGKLLVLDYGLTALEFFAPERAQGTLRAYHHHKLTADVLAQPGEKDITAHVNFTALQAAGEAAGLTTDGLFTQAQFLTPIASRIWSGGTSDSKWTSAKTRQFQTLTHPDHLGRAFRALVQSKPAAD